MTVSLPPSTSAANAELLKLALAELEAKNYDQVLKLTEVILSKEINNAQALEYKFLAYHRMRDFEKALEVLDLFQSWWDTSACSVAKSSVLVELRRPEEALFYGDRAVKGDPKNAHGWLNRAVCYMLVGEHFKAARDLREAKKLEPNMPEIYNNLGVLYGDLRDNKRAIKELEIGINLKEITGTNNWNSELRWNRATILLRQGDFVEGFKEHEKRHDIPNLFLVATTAPFNSPRWDPIADGGIDGLVGRTIIMDNEQGMGDFIQFSRYAKVLTDRGVKVLLEVEPFLVGIAQRILGIDGILEKASSKPRPHHDYWYNMMSFPYALGTTIDTIPAPTQLNLIDQHPTIIKWKSLLGPKQRHRIGIAWSGREEYKQDHRRSMKFKEFMQMLPEGPEYCIIQKEVRPSDTTWVKGRKDVRYFGHHLDDLVDTAELINNLDMVISVDTGVAHLAATLGKETWILLHYCSDWRWLMNDKKTSPWYPSVKLYRPDDIETGWRKVISRVKNDVRKKFSL